MFKKLRISLISSYLVVTKTLNSNHRMHNLYANINCLFVVDDAVDVLFDLFQGVQTVGFELVTSEI